MMKQEKSEHTWKHLVESINLQTSFFGITVQKYVGQAIHLTVMLSKQLFEFLLFCHTLLIHTKAELLNPQ